MDDNMISDAELAALPDRPRECYRDAAERCRNAVTLFDPGIARGLLLSLLKEGCITDSTFDRMFKRAYSQVPPEVRRTVPAELTSNLGRGIVVPASPSARRRHAREASPDA
jgi:hypothetical protein